MDRSEINKVANHPLQTQEWGEFRREWGNEVVWTKYGLITIHHIPFTKHSVGMLIKGPKPTQEMFDDLKILAKQKNLIFIKLEPNVPVQIQQSDNNDMHVHSEITTQNELEKLLILLNESGCVRGKTLFTPTTFWIDLTRGEDDILKSFHPKTRYNIKIAQKHEVEVSENNSDKAFEKYIELTRETVERQGFYAHNEKYHRLMWKYLHESRITNHESPIAHLLTAKYRSAIITTWILFVWKDFLYYPYGASSEKYKNVMANNLMMWEVIRFGKKLGLKTFDLWGREPGKGFTKFKEGYNPKVIEFLGTWDLITSPLYWPYRAAEFFRWLILRAKSKFTKTQF